MKGIYGYYDLEKECYRYIGKDSNIDKNKRHKKHLSPSLYDAQLFNRVLQNNPERFHYVVLNEFPDDFPDEDLCGMEMQYIEVLNTFNGDNPDGLNFTRGGDGVSGYTHSEETRAKLSEAHKGKTLSQEHKDKLSENHADVSGENNPMYGKQHSEETRAKMSENHADVSGENNPQAKYNLWDITKTYYQKGKMFNGGREPNPCKCFKVKYNGKKINIGYFHDFITTEIINDIIKKEEDI